MQTFNSLMLLMLSTQNIEKLTAMEVAGRKNGNKTAAERYLAKIEKLKQKLLEI